MRPYSWAKKTQGQNVDRLLPSRKAQSSSCFDLDSDRVTVLVPRQTEVSISVWGKPSELGNSLLSTNQRPFIYTGPQALSWRPSTIRSQVGAGFEARAPPPPPKMGIPHFSLAYFLKVNGPQRHFSWGILHKRHFAKRLCLSLSLSFKYLLALYLSLYLSISLSLFLSPPSPSLSLPLPPPPPPLSPTRSRSLFFPASLRLSLSLSLSLSPSLSLSLPLSLSLSLSNLH